MNHIKTIELFESENLNESAKKRYTLEEIYKLAKDAGYSVGSVEMQSVADNGQAWYFHQKMGTAKLSSGKEYASAINVRAFKKVSGDKGNSSSHGLYEESDVDHNGEKMSGKTHNQIHERKNDDFREVSRLLGLHSRPSSDQASQKKLLSSQPGDIIQLNGNKEYVLLSHPSSGRNSNISFSAIFKHSLKPILTGTPGKKDSTYTVTFKSVTSFKKLGTITPKELKKLLGVKSDIIANNEKIKSKNYSQIEWDSQKHEYGVTMQDYEKAFVGDRVLVKFSNGTDIGTIKQIAGNDTGKIVILFGRRKKGRGIPPRMIMNKVN